MQTINVHRSLKEKQRQEREELIVRVAEEVLMEKGYHETSMDEIATRVGVAKGTVYLHFPSKEELVVAVFRRDLQVFLQKVEAAAVSAGTPREKLEAILQVMSQDLFSKRIQLLYSLYNGANAELKRLFMEKKSCVREMWEPVTALVTSLLEEGKANGEFDSSLPTPVMLSAFFSLLSPRSYERLMMENQMPPEEAVKHLGHIYFKGIAAN
jgi:TetR/AcrR family transcriptional regulator, fatty acid metabolism regulator protein